MTESMADCPSPERLKDLIDGLLSADDSAIVQSHVDQCPACQKTLESLVAGGASWDAALNHLKEEPTKLREPVLADAIEQMKINPFDSINPDERSGSILDFLEPSDHPNSMGRLGQYHVTEVVGQGGMGIVVKAFDSVLHRVVAVKVLAPHLAHNPQARKRFVREAKAIAAVSHDHVITIHAIDESSRQPTIVMQYIHGRSLQQKLDAEGSLELKELLRIGMQTAAGLAAAHAQGLVHRDVKPSNILLENSIQRVKLTDFGLARAVDDASLTQSGVIAGTPQYMAPEQANGDAVDYRADLFSLGSVLYAMCVGHSPFRASTTMGVLKRVCHDPPRPIQELNPDIPDWLCAIVMKLLEKKPEDRFPTARSVAELLERWLAHVQQPLGVAKPELLVEPSATSMKESPSVENDSKPASSAWPNRPILIVVAVAILFWIGSSPIEVAVLAALTWMTRWIYRSWTKSGDLATIEWPSQVEAAELSGPREAGATPKSETLSAPFRFRIQTLALCAAVLLSIVLGRLLIELAVSRPVWNPQENQEQSLSAFQNPSKMTFLLLQALSFGLVCCGAVAAVRYLWGRYLGILSTTEAGRRDPNELRFHTETGRWFLLSLIAGAVVAVLLFGLPANVNQVVPVLASGMLIGLAGCLPVAVFRYFWAWANGIETTVAEEPADDQRSQHISFRPISGKWLVISLLSGLALTAAVSWSGEAGRMRPVDVFFGGLATGFGVFLVISLARIVWGNVRNIVFSTTRDAEGNVVQSFDTKRMAAWIKATPQTLAAAAGRAADSIHRHVEHAPRIAGEFARSTIESLRDRSRPSSALLLSIGWCLVGGFDVLLATMIFFRSPFYALIFLASGVVSFVVTQCIYTRQNFDLARQMTFVGLAPLSLSAFVRIPLSIITLFWLDAVGIRESFDRRPWPETSLGQLIDQRLFPFLKRSRAFGAKSIVTLIWLAVWSTLCYVLIVVVFFLEVWPYWSATYQIRDLSSVKLIGPDGAKFQLLATGSGSTVGFQPPPRTCARQELLLGCEDKQCTRGMKVRLGETLTNVTTGRELTQSDIEQRFIDLFGTPYPEHAASLLATLRRLNADEASITPPKYTGSISERWQLAKTAFPLASDHPARSFVRVSDMLDRKLFHADVKTQNFPVTFEVPVETTIASTLFAALVWLVGVALIVRWRYFRRIPSLPPMPVAI